MERYIRKAPLPVEAVQFLGGELQAAEIDSWLELWGDVRYKTERFVESDAQEFVGSDLLIPVIQIPEHLNIITDAGNYHVPLSYWIVKKGEGFLSVMNDETFQNSYERYTE